MSINISTYFPVTSTVESVLADTKVFAGIGLTASLRIPTTTPVLKFNNLADVGTYFGGSSNEYGAAENYFKTSDTALAVPAYIYFGKYVVAAIAPYLRSATISNTATMLTALKTVSAGQISVTVNGVTYSTSAINLSAATSLSNACSLLTTAITTANAALGTASFTITFDSTFNQFVAAIPGTGVTKTMNYFSSTGSPNLATIMTFTLATNAVLSQGADAASPTTNLNTILPYFTDQFSIAFVDTMSGDLDDEIMLEVAGWVSDQSNSDRFAFFLWSDEIALESLSDTTSIQYQINQAGYNNAAIFDEVLYDTSDRVFAAMGIFASVDLSQPNSALTLAFKTQTGLQASVISDSVANNLDTKQINYYGNVSIPGSSLVRNWFYGGYIGGKWTYIDNLVAQVWIAFRFQVALANLFSQIAQIPNDPDGDGLIRSTLNTEAQSFITSGIIAVGVVFSNSTVQQIKTTFGVNAQELTNNGYVIVNAAPTQSQRQNRQSPTWYFLYVKGSAVQYLPIRTVTYY